MLAHQESLVFKDLQRLQYPVAVTPKIDGIRCRLLQHERSSIEPVRAYSRTLKPIPNCHISAWAIDHGISGLDGELYIEGATFHEIQSKVMTAVTLPFKWKYCAFDYHDPHRPKFAGLGYLQRVQKLIALLEKHPHPKYEILEPLILNTPAEVHLAFQSEIQRGGEGIIIRSPSGLYKNGRATFNEGSMFKMKQFETGIATVVASIELDRNENPAETDELGYAKRSTHKANLRGAETLGAVEVYDADRNMTFRIGSGFDEAERSRLWSERKSLIGRKLRYKYQVQGEKNKPRTPIFLQWLN